MSDDEPAVPEKYRPEPRKRDQKAWLYEQYWGEDLLSAAEIAAKCDLSQSHVSKVLRRKGIPTRVMAYSRDNSTSPFAGFYRGTDKPAPDEDPSATEYDPEYMDDVKPRWERLAEKDSSVNLHGVSDD